MVLRMCQNYPIDLNLLFILTSHIEIELVFSINKRFNVQRETHSDTKNICIFIIYQRVYYAKDINKNNTFFFFLLEFFRLFFFGQRERENRIEG